MEIINGRMYFSFIVKKRKFFFTAENSSFRFSFPKILFLFLPFWFRLSSTLLCVSNSLSPSLSLRQLLFVYNLLLPSNFTKKHSPKICITTFAFDGSIFRPSSVTNHHSSSVLAGRGRPQSGWASSGEEVKSKKKSCCQSRFSPLRNTTTTTGKTITALKKCVRRRKREREKERDVIITKTISVLSSLFVPPLIEIFLKKEMGWE